MVGLGVGILLLVLILPIMIAAYSARELQRQKACNDGLEDGCEPSLIWLINDSLDESVLGDQKASVFEGERESRTSVESPRVTTLELVDASQEADKYLIRAGGLKLNAWIEGQVESVEVRYIATDTATPGIGKQIGNLTKQADGSFGGSVQMTLGQAGELEVRAVYRQEYGSRIVKFAVN